MSLHTIIPIGRTGHIYSMILAAQYLQYGTRRLNIYSMIPGSSIFTAWYLAAQYLQYDTWQLNIYSMIPGSSIHFLDATNKKDFSALKSTQHFTLTSAVARTRRWRQQNPLKRQITSIRARGVTSSFLTVTPFYRLTVGAGVIVAPDHVLRHTHSVVLLWARDQPVAETSNWQHKTLTTQNTHNTKHSQHKTLTTRNTHNKKHSQLHAPAGFETAFPACKRPHTHALDCSAMASHFPLHKTSHSPPRELQISRVQRVENLTASESNYTNPACDTWLWMCRASCYSRIKIASICLWIMRYLCHNVLYKRVSRQAGR